MPNKATFEDNTYAVGKEKSENSLEHSVSDQTRAENAIGHLLDQINGRERYDAEAKALLSVKIFLVRILKGLIEPFSRFTDVAILRESFVGEIYLERMSVDDNSSAQIMGKNTEGSSIESGSIYYDLVLYVKLPSSPQGVVDFIINIEIQGKDSRFTPKRGGYYGARLISSEKGRVFIKEEYKDMVKVYTIWIMYDPKYGNSNTILGFSLKPEYMVGKASCEKECYDLLSIIQINLGDPDGAAKGSILRLLDILLHGHTIETQEKFRLLESEFGIQVTEPIRKGVKQMRYFIDGYLEEIIREKDKEKNEEIQNVIRERDDVIRERDDIIKKLLEEIEVLRHEKKAV